jgi:putative phosphoesterase
MRIGLISDSHLHSDRRPLWNEVVVAFAGVDLIVHAGDILGAPVLDWLERIAPVKAALGNNDEVSLTEDPRLARVQMLDVEGWRVAVIHDMEPEDQSIEDLRRIFLEGRRADIFVTGHTHYERVDYRDGVIQVNPGSPTLPHNFSTRLGTVGLLDLGPDNAEVKIIRLGESPGLRNPGIEHRFSTRRPGLSS